MKAILEFDLDDHEDKMSHKRCVASLDMALVLWEIVHNSWRGEGTDDNTMKAINSIYNKHGIHIDNLIE